MENILANIKAIRSKQGYSQDYMASKLQIEQASYGLIENGKRKLKYEQLEQIALIFQMSVIDIITFPEKFVKFKNEPEPIKTTVSIEIFGHKKDKVLSLILGDDYENILNK